MSIKQNIKAELSSVSRLLVSTNFAKEYKFHNFDKSKNNLVWDGYQNLAFTLQRENYDVIYSNIIMNRDFSYLLFDGAIIQIQYQFIKNVLIRHILSYFPNPYILPYFKIPEEFEAMFYSDQVYADQVSAIDALIPIRIDYSPEHQDVIHPMVHLTFHGIKDCRIPLVAPLSPMRFIKFILMNFYTQKFNELYEIEDFERCISFPNSITPAERKVIHISFE